jgi:pyruvate dehydrogenase E2 component (dihydrolipoamide acetyltransferase)
MPALEMAQETGKLVSWKKKEGEQVKKGEILLEVETDKAVVEIEAAVDGVLAGVTAKVDDVVPVGQIIAWLLKAGESVPANTGAPQMSGRKMDATPAAAAATPAPEPVAPASVAGAKISPKARRLAREHNVDISKVRGSGPGGEILADDILSAARMPAPAEAASAPAAAPAAPAPAAAKPTAPPAVAAAASTDMGAVSSIGKIMAERTTQSWTQVPQFYVTRAVDASNLNASRARRVPEIERSHSVKVTHTDILVAAVARALRHFPRMNGSWNNGAIAMHAEVNVALAMAVENAVVTAVIKNADKLALGDIAKARKELTERARANRLTPADIQGATFTISNLGMMEVDAFTAIIVPPQAAILAVGAIADRVVAVNGQPAVRPMMSMTLSSDHRVVDGVRAAEFMRDLANAIKSPQL